MALIGTLVRYGSICPTCPSNRMMGHGETSNPAGDVVDEAGAAVTVYRLSPALGDKAGGELRGGQDDFVVRRVVFIRQR